MKYLVLFLFSVTLTLNSFCQTSVDTLYLMTSEQNKEWLEKVKNANKELQFRLVKERLFESRTISSQEGNLDAPMMIIDGVPIVNNNAQKEFLSTEFTAEIVEIKVLDKDPENLYIEKRFTGIILITIKDKKLSKKFKRLK
ncbi:MAG TPA: hypothetical protein VFU05_06845 [Cyclobacteriaceae bacterium]|nr:hypothetical protein [Cyclobacteriaceae bacterium]